MRSSASEGPRSLLLEVETCCAVEDFKGKTDPLPPTEMISFHMAHWNLIRSESGTWASSFLKDSPKHRSTKAFPLALILHPQELGSWAWNCTACVWQQISQAPAGKQALVHQLKDWIQSPSLGWTWASLKFKEVAIRKKQLLCEPRLLFPLLVTNEEKSEKSNCTI